MQRQTIQNNTIPSFDTTALHKAISQKYGEVARNPSCGFHFTTGRPLAHRLLYSNALLSKVPEEIVQSFAGVGNPFLISAIKKGASILDIGSGAGMDAFIARILAGKGGNVHGIDLTMDMVRKAHQYARSMQLDNLVFEQGHAERLPYGHSTFDTIISNGVINLCPDKTAVYKEAYRVLKPGGILQLADVVLANPVPDNSRDLIHLWTDCIAGAIPEEEYINLIRSCGFNNVRIIHRFDVFGGARIEPSARHFGAVGANIYGEKPRS